MNYVSEPDDEWRSGMARRRTSLISAAVAASLLIGLGVATVSAESPMAPLNATVTMTGDQEVWATCAPPTVCGDPDATGTAKIIVSPVSDRVCFSLSWEDINGDVWGAHIHGPISTSDPAPIRVGFLMLAPGAADSLEGTDRIAGCVLASAVSAGAEETWADRIAADPGDFYVNVHASPSFNPGAIRAELDD
jgi:hypothetical protein